jgi:hypothetical protein
LPERRTVLYTFEETREARETDRKAPPGLVRIDLDWRNFLERSTKSRRSGRSTVASGTEAVLAEAVESIGLTSSSAFELLPESSWIHVPEVVYCEFRYFDGSAWTDEWDSHSRKSLPAAVEVTMQLNPPPERWKPRTSRNEEASAQRQDVPEGPKDKAEGLSRTPESQRPVYRQVIALRPSSNGEHPRATAGEAGLRQAGSSFHDTRRRGDQ